MVLPSAAAPRFVYLAGACGGQPVGGGGADLVEAAGRLAGEASEVLVQATSPERSDAPAHPDLASVWGGGGRIVAKHATQGRRVAVPSSAIYPAFEAPAGAPPRSLGLAAGPNAEAARLAGLLEVIERDAAAAWWSGLARPRAIDAAAIGSAGEDLARMRAGCQPPQRIATCFRLASGTGVPVVCAMSRDGDGGGGLVLGFKAALDLQAAITGAMREMLQMEIALEIARMRRARGPAAAGDAGLLARAALDPDAFPAFAPLPPTREPESRRGGFAGLVGHLGACGVEVIVADLEGLDGGLSVAKVFAPGLRPLRPRDPRPDPDAPGAWADLM